MDNLANISLLIVEDSKETVDALVEILQEYIQTIHIAHNGMEGLSIFSEEEIDIVLSDIEMPKMDGITMSQEIKKTNPHQDIIIMSAFDNKEYLFKAIDCGINNYIMKPIVDVEKLLNNLDEIAKKILIKQELKMKDFRIRQQADLIDKYILQSISDLDGNMIDVSQACADLTGYTKEELLETKSCPHSTNNYQTAQIKDLWGTISNDDIWHGELKNFKKNGQPFWVKSIISPLYDASGEKIGYTAIKEDITDKKKYQELAITDSLTSLHNRRYFEFYMKQEMKKASKREENFALLLIDVDHFKNYNDTYGHQRGDWALVSLAELFSLDIGSMIDGAFRVGGEEFAITLVNKKDEEIIEYVNTLQSKLKEKAIEHTSNNVSELLTISIGAVNIHTFEPMYTSETLFNMTDNNLYAAKEAGKNRYIFTNDVEYTSDKNVSTVSKLKNREDLLKELTIIHEESMLFIFHLNNLQNIESLYGTDTLKKVMVDKTKELEALVIDQEVCLYKINAKEFALLVTEDYLFDKYIDLIESILIDNCSLSENNTQAIVSNFTVGVSTGIVNLLYTSGKALETALNKNLRFFQYDEALYNMNKDLSANGMKDLKVYRDALHNGNIVPYLQPIVDVNTEEVVKYEALARIVTEDGRVVSPNFFLKEAEEDKSFEFFSRQLMQKIFHVYEKNDIAISINLTYENIISKSMVTYIKNRLDKHGGEKITFEIVESEMIEDYTIVENFISMIKEYGCKVSIDDFGSGYSNFTNLVKLNADYIKLDGSLIEKLMSDTNVQTMVKALVTFAKGTNIQTVAEYVSSQEIAQVVKSYGIDLSQGYYYGRPREPKEYGLDI